MDYVAEEWIQLDAAWQGLKCKNTIIAHWL